AGVVDAAEADAEHVDEVGLVAPEDDELGGVAGVAEVAAEVVPAGGNGGGDVEGVAGAEVEVVEVDAVVDAGEVVVEVEDGAGGSAVAAEDAVDIARGVASAVEPGQ